MDTSGGYRSPLLPMRIVSEPGKTIQVFGFVKRKGQSPGPAVAPTPNKIRFASSSYLASLQNVARSQKRVQKRIFLQHRVCVKTLRPQIALQLVHNAKTRPFAYRRGRCRYRQSLAADVGALSWLGGRTGFFAFLVGTVGNYSTLRLPSQGFYCDPCFQCEHHRQKESHIQMAKNMIELAKGKYKTPVNFLPRVLRGAGQN